MTLFLRSIVEIDEVKTPEQAALGQKPSLLITGCVILAS